MAISSQALKALMKQKIDAIDTSTAIGNDALLTAIAESMVIAFNENLIESALTRNGGVGDSQVFLEGTEPTLAWDSAPTGTYEATNPGGLAKVGITINTTGGWVVGGIGADEDSGRWRPTSDNNTTSYEVRVTATGDTVSLSGSISSLNTWLDLDDAGTVNLNDVSAGSKSASVTVEIRQKSNTSNTTGVASFTLVADGGSSL